MRPLTTLWLAGGLAAGLMCSAAALAAEPAGAAQLEQRVRRLENMLDSDQLVRLMQQIDGLTGEIRDLRGAIETQGHRIEELRERQRRLYSDLDRRLRQLEVAGRQQREHGQEPGQGPGQGSPGAGSEATQGNAGAGAGGAGSGSASDASTASVEAQRKAYDAAFALLRQGRYEAAGRAFSEFLKQYPRGPYSDNAQYWLGGTRYVRRDFEGALEGFRQVVERYPESPKVGDAELKIGYTLYELGRYDKARTVLRRVMSKYSGTSVARLAEERLLRLEHQTTSN